MDPSEFWDTRGLAGREQLEKASTKTDETNEPDDEGLNVSTRTSGLVPPTKVPRKLILGS